MLRLCRSPRRRRISRHSELSGKVWVWGVWVKVWGALALAARWICMHRVHCAPYVLPLRRAQRSPQISAPLQVPSAVHLFGHAGELLRASAGTPPPPPTPPPLARFPLHFPPPPCALTFSPSFQLAQVRIRLLLRVAPCFLALSSSPFYGLAHCCFYFQSGARCCCPRAA